MTQAKLGEDLLTMQQTIEMLRTTRPTLNRWLREGKLSGVKVGRQWRFPRAEVERFLEGSPRRASLGTDPRPLLEALRASLPSSSPSPSGEDPMAEAFSLMVQLALHRDASSLSLETSLTDAEGTRAGWLRFRIDGVWQVICQMDARLVAPLVEQWKAAAACDVRDVSVPQDGRVLVSTGATAEERRMVDLRVAFLPCMLGESMTVKVLDPLRSRQRLEQLDLAPRELALIRTALRSRGRLVVVAGLAGSARTTLLAAALRDVSGPQHKLMTVEGQAWPVLPWAVQVSTRLGQSRSTAVAIGTVLRSDPDIIGVETIANNEALLAAQDACRQGALVVAGVPYDGAIEALRALTDMAGGAPPTEVDHVVAQRLLRKLCPECAVPHKLSAGERKELVRLASRGGAKLTGKDFRRPVGCAACAGSGFRKRVMVAEGLRLGPAIRQLLRDGATDEALLQAAVADGMVKLDAQSIVLAACGLTSVMDVLTEF